MSDREANVRLNLSAAGFMSALQALEKESKGLERAIHGVGDGAERASKKTSLLGSSMKAGFGAAKSSLAELGSQLKSTLATAATLGGALSIGAGVRGALDLISTYKDIAFAIQAGTGKARDWRQVQGDVEAIGARWKTSNESVAESYLQLWRDVGDADYAIAAAEEVAKAHTATGESMESLSAIAGALNEKFSITKEQLPDAMAALIAMGNKGGVSVAELGEKIGIVGASAKLMGLSGKAGLQQVMGMLNSGDQAVGSLKKNIAAVSGLMETFGDSAKVKNIEKTLGVSLRTKKGDIKGDALETILKKSGGKEEILKKAGFEGDTLKLVKSFGDTYAKAFTETKGTVKQKTDAALGAYHAALEEAGRQTLTAADVQTQATARLKDPARQLDDAMNRFKEAFERPEVVEAIDKIAEAMPKLAKVLGDVVGFAADHPKEAVALGVAAKVAPAAGAAVVGTILKKVFTKAAGAGAGAAVAEGGAALAGGGMAIGAGGLAAVGGLGLVAAGGFGAAGYNAAKLYKENKNNEGILAGLGNAVKTTLMGPSAPLSGKAYDERMRRLFEPPKPSLAHDVPDVPGHRSGSEKGAKAVANDIGNATAEKIGAKELKVRITNIHELNRGGSSGSGESSTNGLPPKPGNDSGSGAS